MRHLIIACGLLFSVVPVIEATSGAALFWAVLLIQIPIVLGTYSLADRIERS